MAKLSSAIFLNENLRINISQNGNLISGDIETIILPILVWMDNFFINVTIGTTIGHIYLSTLLW